MPARSWGFLEGAPPGLMRDFLEKRVSGAAGRTPTASSPTESLEKRVALSDHRTLADFATFLSFGWQEARMTANTHLEAFCGPPTTTRSRKSRGLRKVLAKAARKASRPREPGMCYFTGSGGDNHLIFPNTKFQEPFSVLK